MNREQARLLLEALRRGDRKSLAEMRARLMQNFRIVCAHCGEQAAPGACVYDFAELTVSAECRLCGTFNRLPIRGWSDGPLQPPPAS